MIKVSDNVLMKINATINDEHMENRQGNIVAKDVEVLWKHNSHFADGCVDKNILRRRNETIVACAMQDP